MVQYTTGAGLSDGSATFTYAYDANENVSSFEQSFSGTLTGPGRFTHLWASTYDNANQLTALSNTAFGGVLVTETASSFVYDPAGNLAFDSTQPGFLPAYTATNELQNLAGTNTFDETGNLTGLANALQSPLAPALYGYDDLGQLASASGPNGTSAFTYDGLGHLVGVTQTSTAGQVLESKSYFWCGKQMCLEHDNLLGPAVQPPGVHIPPPVDKVYFPQGVLAGVGTQPIYGSAPAQGPPSTGAAISEYYIRDNLGSVIALVNGAPNGNVLAQYTYDPFGTRTRVAGAGSDSDIGYAGYFHDQVSGLDFARHRVYAAPLRRWLTRDPIGNGHAFANPTRFTATDWNLYAYADSNPLSFIDPSGLDPLGAALGASIGGSAFGWLGGTLGAGGGLLTGPGAIAASPAGAVAGFAGGAAFGALVGGTIGNAVGDWILEARPAKPDGLPTGTVPIDQSPWGKKIHRAKPGLGQGPKDWTGVSPDGTIWADDGTGQGIPIGHVDDCN
jgi:RHS repeat-associated protein